MECREEGNFKNCLIIWNDRVGRESLVCRISKVEVDFKDVFV